MKFVFTNYAKKQLLNLDNKTQQIIKNKLIILKTSDLLLKQNIKAVVNLAPATHRIRIGSHRLLLQINDAGYIVLKVGNRKDIYKS